MADKVQSYGMIKSAGDLNAGSVTTDWAVCDKWDRACFDVEITKASTLSQVDVELQHTRDGGTTVFTLPIVATDGSMVDIVSRTIAASDNYSIVADVEAIGEIRAVLAPTGAGAGDLATVKLYSRELG